MRFHRPISGAAIALALGPLFLVSLFLGPLAAEPAISVLNSGRGAEYRDVIDGLISKIDAEASLAAQSASDTPAWYLDLNGPLEGFPDFAALDPRDQALLRAAKQTYDLFRAMGGERLDRFAMLQRQDNRYYIAVDGEGGRWVVSIEAALSVLLEKLVGAETGEAVAEPVKADCDGDLHCSLLETYMGMISTITYVPRDSTVTLEITIDDGGSDGGAEQAPPVLLAPDGMVVHDVTINGSGNIMATVSIHGTAPLGMSILNLYSEGHGFRSLAQLGVEVMANPAELASLATESNASNAGSGDFQPLIDDHPAVAASATALVGTGSGRLEAADDADLFKVVVEQTGILSLTSQGPTDVMATLETEEGAVLATDDDSGERYNFTIEQPVNPGTYYLRVTHCCNGLGNYRLSTSIAPN